MGKTSQVLINNLNTVVDKTYYLPLIENLSGDNSVNADSKLYLNQNWDKC